MSRQIIIQPNGKYAIWSTTIDNFTHQDLNTTNDVVDALLDEQRREITHMVHTVVHMLLNGGKPYRQFTRSYEECVKIRRKR